MVVVVVVLGFYVSPTAKVIRRRDLRVGGVGMSKGRVG